MPTNRRKFIQQAAFAALATATVPAWLQAAPRAKTLMGVQLYSVRDEMKKDPLATLKALADMGYKYVEHANYINRKFYGYPAAEFKKVLNDLGLTMPSGHTVMEVFNKSGELCNKSGMRFGYHNHNFEFTQKLGDETVYEIILKNTDPLLVAQQLDFGNLYGTGADALAIVQNNPGRFVSMHVKDEIMNAKGTGYESTVLGKGVQVVKKIIDQGKKTGGTLHFIVEQEAYQGIAPLECIRQNYNKMKEWGY